MANLLVRVWTPPHPESSYLGFSSGPRASRPKARALLFDDRRATAAHGENDQQKNDDRAKRRERDPDRVAIPAYAAAIVHRNLDLLVWNLQRVDGRRRRRDRW